MQMMVQVMVAGGIKSDAIRFAVGMLHGSPISKTCYHKHFKEAIDHGRELIDAKVINALFKNCLGGNARAQVFWLSARRPEGWAINYRHKHGGDQTGEPVEITFDMGGLPPSRNAKKKGQGDGN